MNSYELPPDQLKNLKIFIEFVKNAPQILHLPELNFFKQYIESLGGVIPASDASANEKPKQPEPKPAPEEPKLETLDEESAESEVELDYEGVVEPDNDPPQMMGYSEQEVSEEDIEKSNERKRAAIDLYAEQKYEEAVNAYTEAILLNPASALLYAKRGQCFLQLQKPNACIRDCTRALEINPDSAAAYKFRGRAHRLLGKFLKAAEDLRSACKIDYDEQTDEWLKEVTPNARKLEEHQRKYERKRLEKEVKETRERVRRMREEQQKRVAEEKEKEKQNAGDSDDEGIDGGPGGMGDFLNLMKDPEVLQAFQDPEVAAAFQDISQNPANVLKYQNNPKVNAMLMKLSSKFSGVGGQMPGFGGAFPGFPGFGGGAGARNPPPPPPPRSGSDVDLD